MEASLCQEEIMLFEQDGKRAWTRGKRSRVDLLRAFLVLSKVQNVCPIFWISWASWSREELS